MMDASESLHEVAPVAKRTTSGLEPGVIIDRKYRIETLVGEGGMGMVWLATHVDLDRPVAVKVVREELARQDEIVARLLIEARAVAQLRGEHVVRVLDVGRLESGAPYIVMEYLEGNDVFSELAARGPLPIQEAIDLVLQACEGLAEAHSLGFVHRDLKPENLFLAVQPDRSLVLKILDFGITKQMHGSPHRRRMTLAACPIGSPQYMPPEQMLGLPDVDQRADIWALGVILYELLTGVCPFDSGSPEEIRKMVLEDEPPMPRAFRPDLPEALQTVVLRCLEKPLNRRYATVDELALELAPFGGPYAKLRAEKTVRVSSSSAPTMVALDSAPTASLQPARESVPATAEPADFRTSSTAPAAISVAVPLVKRRSRGVMWPALGAMSIAAGAAGLWWHGSAGSVELGRSADVAVAAAQRATSLIQDQIQVGRRAIAADTVPAHVTVDQLPVKLPSAPDSSAATGPAATATARRSGYGSPKARASTALTSKRASREQEVAEARPKPVSLAGLAAPTPPVAPTGSPSAPPLPRQDSADAPELNRRR
jgi:serine/threonine-protein kinase